MKQAGFLSRLFFLFLLKTSFLSLAAKSVLDEFPAAVSMKIILKINSRWGFYDAHTRLRDFYTNGSYDIRIC